MGKFSRRVQVQRQQNYWRMVHFNVSCGTVATVMVLLPLALLLFMDLLCHVSISNIVITVRVAAPVLRIGTSNATHNIAALSVGAPLTLGCLAYFSSIRTSPNPKP